MGASFELPFIKNQINPEITVHFPLELCPKLWTLNFVMASQQNSSTVEPVDYTYDGSVRRGWLHKVYYTLVDCNPLPLLPVLRRQHSAVR